MDDATDEQKDQNDRDDEVLERHARALMEHFDAVQILVSRHDADSGDTWTTSKGYGNYNTRYGMMRKWLSREDSKDGSDHEL